MSDVPAWLTGVLYEREFAGRILSENQVWAVAVAVWAEVENHIQTGEWYDDEPTTLFDDAESPRFRTLSGEPRTIPSRNSDPSTSHRAEPGKMRANSQRARLLKSFWLMERYQPEGNGLTDEEAMEWAVGVPPNSEYSKRCSELREAGFIEATGETRPGSSGHDRIVSRITDAGRAWIRDNT